jgi:hypothetical protein
MHNKQYAIMLAAIPLMPHLPGCGWVLVDVAD